MCVPEERGNGAFETELPSVPPMVLRDPRCPLRIARRTITLEPVPHKGKTGRKLADFRAYHNAARSHASLEGHTPLTFAGEHTVARAELNNVRWVSHCRTWSGSQ